MNAISTSLLENNSERLVHPGAEASSFGGLTCNTNEIKGDPFPTSSRKPAGQAYEENT